MNKLLVNIISLFLLVVFQSCSYSMKSEKDVALIIGISDVEIRSSKSSSESFLIHDFDDLEIYELSDSTINLFLNQSTFILYEDFYEKRYKYQKKNWAQTPIDTLTYAEVLDWALVSRNDYFRDKCVKQIKKLLLSKHAYYAFYYARGDVAFYILDTFEDKLYIIYFKA